MRKMTEYRSLINVRCFYNRTGDVESWTLQGAGSVYVFAGSIESFTSFLRLLKASDTNSLPKSVRNLSYKDIASKIQSGVDTDIWVWSFIWAQLNTGSLLKSL
jgi:hypothetical protein